MKSSKKGILDIKTVLETMFSGAKELLMSGSTLTTIDGRELPLVQKEKLVETAPEVVAQELAPDAPLVQGPANNVFVKAGSMLNGFDVTGPTPASPVRPEVISSEPIEEVQVPTAVPVVPTEEAVVENTINNEVAPELETPTLVTPQQFEAQASVPTIEVPEIVVPKVEMPAVEYNEPEISVPTIEVPSVSTPIEETPVQETPEIVVPTMGSPEIEAPTIELPAQEAPAIEPIVASPINETPVPTPVVTDSYIEAMAKIEKLRADINKRLDELKAAAGAQLDDLSREAERARQIAENDRLAVRTAMESGYNMMEQNISHGITK